MKMFVAFTKLFERTVFVDAMIYFTLSVALHNFEDKYEVQIILTYSMVNFSWVYVCKSN